MIRKITTTVLPRSIAELGRTASSFDLEDSKYPIQGQAWLPPLLGAFRPSSKDGENALDDSPTEEEDDFENDDDEHAESESDDDSTKKDFALSPDASRDLHAVLRQLRTVTARLSQLERLNNPAPATSSEKGTRSGTEQELLSNQTIKWIATGITVGAASAAVFWQVWNRRRK